uniref:GSVIVT01030279001 n=1 Tax=Arundo donax TaxID=35708 RepID=A0A0A9EQJ4_ARUDO
MSPHPLLLNSRQWMPIIIAQEKLMNFRRLKRRQVNERRFFRQCQRPWL